MGVGARPNSTRRRGRIPELDERADELWDVAPQARRVSRAGGVVDGQARTHVWGALEG